uniref:Small ribosomal subunit protein uS3c n=2 Tax=Putranjivaceae TaxID=233879 RepID=A0A7G8QD57_9ROSI|nr:ribosomal protein S3 [Drypetes lateriflora]YP_009975524.1 ribosomal protein S3 [Sibangea similis]QNK04715.1 ribosomal protein S3 [Drypetes lateriflora]QNK04866.1 ribosomal protein S3 [Sibangea similis]
MGQKINPLGFRLGKTQRHYSLWFAQPKNFYEDLEEDQKIRNCIKNFVQKIMKISYGVDGLARIEIQKQKNIDAIRVIIYMGFPHLFTKNRPKIMEELLMNVQKEINCVNRTLNIDLRGIENPYGHPTILAEFIGEQIKNRVSYHKVMKKAIELNEQTDTKGIQIKIAGRLAGRDRARTAWMRKGRVPLQTVRAKFDYCSYMVTTIKGVLGIKIWIFVDEEY